MLGKGEVQVNVRLALVWRGRRGVGGVFTFLVVVAAVAGEEILLLYEAQLLVQPLVLHLQEGEVGLVVTGTL